MSSVLAFVFQVLVSGAFSFLGAACIMLVGTRLLRLRDGRARLVAALLPFAKLAYEVARGVPDGGFYWLEQMGARQELGGFRAGLGLDHKGPIVDISLSAIWQGASYPQSAADVLSRALERHVAVHATAAVAAFLCAVAVISAGRALFRFARSDRNAWRAGAELLERRRVGPFTVNVFASTTWDGAPFATGLFAPSVCLPRSIVDALSDEEREAVVQHEIAHVRGRHALVVGALSLFERVFWFVPGLGALARHARAQLEICADDAAVRAGVAPEVLASALVRVAEIVVERRAAPALALFGKRSVAVRRVERLLERRTATKRLRAAAGLFGLVLLTLTILRASTLGNP